jgi:SAM-dependent methyltransferase
MEPSPMPAPLPFSPPRYVDDIADCDFYHTLELPGHGVVGTGFDFREGVDEYLGGVSVSGKRVLEVGPASGFFSFHMEAAGADVTVFEVDDRTVLDVVPYARGTERAARVFEENRRMRNSFWYAHRLLGSAVKMVSGDVYGIPEEIGRFDVAVVGSLLLHLRDPFSVLSRVASLVDETLVVAEPVGIVDASWWMRLLRRSGEPKMIFLPRAATQRPVLTWWTFTPQLICRFMEVLGFEHTKVVRHVQKHADGRPHRFFTVVGRRTIDRNRRGER